MIEFGGWTLRRIAWTATGALALAAGTLGALLPVLPTTPFVILAAFAFGKGSPSLARWLEESRVFGPILSDWRQSGAIAPQVKALSIIMMAGVFALSLALSANTVVLAIQAAVMGAAAVFIVTRPNRSG